MSHTVTASMSLALTAKGKLALMAAGGGIGGDEAARVQKALDANLSKLIEAAEKYGFELSDVVVTVS
jgi:hypothetical protein